MKIKFNQPDQTSRLKTIIIALLFTLLGIAIGYALTYEKEVPSTQVENQTNQNQSPVPGESIRVKGTLIGGGVECPSFRAEDGREYTLAGNLAGHKEGDKITVEGTITELSFCMQGTTITIGKIQPY